MTSPAKKKRIQILVLGDTKVGKTALLRRYNK